MSIATAILRRTKAGPPAKRRRFEIVKVAAAVVFVLLLTRVGFQGRQHARLQARLNDVTLVRDQLQQRLDEQGPAEQAVGGVRAAGSTESRRPLSTAEITTLISALHTRLGQFDSDYSAGKLSEAESLELRLSKATLANAEQRFADALTMITDKDEHGKREGAEGQIGRFIRVLQIRGDSFYGLREWRNALDHYQQVLNLKPNCIVAMTRVADCYHTLGKPNEALIAYAELATGHNDRGDALLVQGKADRAIRHYADALEIQTRLVEKQGQPATELAKSLNNRGDAFLFQTKLDDAIGDYEKAIEILTPLLEKEGRRELASELAKSHNNRGNAFLFQGNLEAALGDFWNSIKILTQLVEKEGRNELAPELAMSHHNRGNAFLAHGELNAAIGDFGYAIGVLTKLVEAEGRSELANDLARSHNNCGVVRRAQGNPDAAIGDFENAIRISTRLIEREGRGESATNPALSRDDRGIVRSAQVKLEVSMEYSENALEALLRTRLIGQGRRRELAVIQAVSLKNRGYAQLVQGKVDAAIGDFKKSIGIYARLVEQEGERDLAPQFAKCLSAIAWIYATNPGNSFRDGGKAKGCALKACELSEWKSFVPLETLAAACAETGQFAEAVKWQQKAVELAPAKIRADLNSRLELYKTGKPYRAPLPKTE